MERMWPAFASGAGGLEWYLQGDGGSPGAAIPSGEYEVETSDLSTAEDVASMAETVISGPDQTDPDSPSPDYLVRGTYMDSAISQIEGMSGVERVALVS